MKYALMITTALTRVAVFDGGAPAPVAVAGSGKRENLDMPSVDHAAMSGYWRKVDDIVKGQDAIRARAEEYLPKFEGESKDKYDVRLKLSRFTNVYRDMVEGLASRPFENEVSLDETGAYTAPQEIVDFIQNVDGAYNNITVFGAATFFNGINDALDWIFVDYPNVPVGTVPRSQADEAALGIRPFWTHVRAVNVLEVKSQVIGGSEAITYMRVLERGEIDIDVRIMMRDGSGARWELWRQERNGVPIIQSDARKPGQGVTTWIKVDEGVFSIGLIPMVPFVTGRREGRRWYVHPPMRDAADLQIELYQAESGLKNIKTLAAYPMVAANGVKPEVDADNKPKPIVLGPMAVLYAPPNGNGQSGSWELLEPGAQSMTFLQTDTKEIKSDLRELGRNPLTAQSGNITVITSGIAAQKGNSAVQMWAFSLQDTLENALMITGLWLGMAKEAAEKVKVKVFTDFEVAAQGNEQLTALGEARKNGDLSRRNYLAELMRRNVLAADFDHDANDEELLDEGPPEDDLDVDPVTGRSGKPAPGKPNAGA